MLKRTVSMGRFFWAPKTYVKIDALDFFLQFYAELFCLYKLVYLCAMLKLH